MKKIVCFLVLLCLIMGAAFAQSKSSSKSVDNWISGEVSLLGIGARYERMLNKNISIGVNAYWNSFIFIWNEIEAGASFRYYIFPIFFIGSGLGFHIHTGTYEYTDTYTDWYGRTQEETYSWFGSVYGVAITPEVGWKIDVGGKGGFFVQPGLKVPVTLGKLQPWGGYDTSEFKVGVGFVPYCGLGFAF